MKCNFPPYYEIMTGRPTNRPTNEHNGRTLGLIGKLHTSNNCIQFEQCMFGDAQINPSWDRWEQRLRVPGSWRRWTPGRWSTSWWDNNILTWHSERGPYWHMRSSQARQQVFRKLVYVLMSTHWKSSIFLFPFINILQQMKEYWCIMNYIYIYNKV